MIIEQQGPEIFNTITFKEESGFAEFVFFYSNSACIRPREKLYIRSVRKMLSKAYLMSGDHGCAGAAPLLGAFTGPIAACSRQRVHWSQPSGGEQHNDDVHVPEDVASRCIMSLVIS